MKPWTFTGVDVGDDPRGLGQTQRKQAGAAGRHGRFQHVEGAVICCGGSAASVATVELSWSALEAELAGGRV